MGVYDGIRKEKKETVVISLNFKKFEDVGYWLRDIKKKLRKKQILNIRITLNIDYFDENTIII
jgi:hypothetical protein